MKFNSTIDKSRKANILNRIVDRKANLSEITGNFVVFLELSTYEKEGITVNDATGERFQQELTDKYIAEYRKKFPDVLLFIEESTYP